MKHIVRITALICFVLLLPAAGFAVTISVTQNNPTCQLCNGSFTAVGSNGTAPYLYSINGGATWFVSGTFTGKCAGTYTVIVQDALNNQASQTFTLVNPPPLVFTAIGTNCTTPTSCDGSISITITGGVPPYTVTLTGPSGNIPFSSSPVTGLCVGTYTLTVTDSTMCSGHSGSPTGPANAIISIGSGGGSTSPLNLSVFGNLGSCSQPCNYLTASGSGGIPPYQYNFGSGWMASPTSGCLLGTGTTVNYTVCVKDAVGSTVCQTIPTGWPLYNWFVGNTIVPAYCGSCSGQIIISYTFPGTTYAINPGNPVGQTSPVFSNLCPGTYTVSVVPPGSSGRCPQMITLNVPNQPGVLGVSTAVTNATCFASCNGSVTITAQGTGPFEYSIDGGNTWQSSATFSGLCAGTYSAQVRNTAHTCSGSASFTITQPASFTPIVTPSSPSCYGGCNGIINTIISPSLSYQYSINGGVTYQTSGVFTGRCAGSYTVTVRNIATGCTTNVPVNVTQPPQITVSTQSITNPQCAAAPTGSVSIAAAGGTGAFTYNWLPGNPSGDGTPTVTNLTAGTYSCVVTDVNNCSTTYTVSLTAPALPTVQLISSSDVTCYGGWNGTAAVTVSGGSTPYSYNWTPGNPTGDGTPSVSGLAPGTWTCTVTAGSPACVTTQIVIITQPAPITGAITSLNSTSCVNTQDGSVTIAASGGTGAYTYSWSPTGGSASTASGLGVGNYTCTITDANGCTGVQPVIITAPALLLASASTVSSPSCNGNVDAIATVLVSGGTAGYTYDWLPGNPIGDGTDTISLLSAGSYTCNITDANGCSASAALVITEPAVLLSSIASQTDPVCHGNNTGSATLSVAGGTAPYQYAWSPSGGNNAIGVNLSAGTYTCVVVDASGCTDTATVNITEPAALLSAIVVQTEPDCHGNSTGSATLSVAGGTAPYQCAWSPAGGNSATGVNLSAGTYTCVVVDAMGCTDTTAVIVTEPSAVDMIIESVSSADCFGSATGDAYVMAFGGAGFPFAYNWQPTGGNSPAAMGLPAGTYTCTATDSLGCADSVVITISEPAAVVASLVAGATTCGQCNGDALASAIGGNGGYTFYWQGIPDSTYMNALCAGTYDLVVADSLGCSDALQFVIGNSVQAHIDSIAVTGTPSTQNNGTATVFGSGNGPLTYAWDAAAGSQTTPTAINLGSGSYCVIITDSTGCTDSACVSVPVITSIGSMDISPLHVFPNPFSTDINVQGTGRWNFTMYDMSGKVVVDFGTITLNGTHTLFVPAELAAGVYLLKASSDAGTQNIRVVKE